MKFSLFTLLYGFFTAALAEDLLFLERLQYREHDEAIALNLSTKIVALEEWANMTTADFAKYKAIIVPDPSCGDLSLIQFLEDSKDAWSPAVTGNIILIGIVFGDSMGRK
jgi:hypothetical protein